jgi:hypothetical protein
LCISGFIIETENFFVSITPVCVVIIHIRHNLKRL